MSGIFGGEPQAPPQQALPEEDPEVKRLREIEQQRAAASRVKATQDQLASETILRNRGLGVSSLTSSAFSRRRGLSSLLGSG